MQLREDECAGHLMLKEHPWPYQLREIISQTLDTPSWPAVHCGSFTVSHHVFLSLSIRIRDVLLHGPLPIDHQSKVLLYYTDTPLSRLKYICTVTALALLGASFTLLEEKMPRRARLHVVEVYSPDLLLDLSSVGSQSVHELLPLQEQEQESTPIPAPPLSLPVLRLDLDEVTGTLPSHFTTATASIPPSPSSSSSASGSVSSSGSPWSNLNCIDIAASLDNASQAEKYKFFDATDWAYVTENIPITVTVTVTTPSIASWHRHQYHHGCHPGRFWCHSTSSDTAFIDWTSGSTGGLPKGCPCKHATLSNMLYAKYFSPAQQLFCREDREVVGVNLFNLWYWWQPICAGHTTALLMSSEVTDITLLFEGISRMRITAMDCITPSLLQTMLYCRASSTEFYIPATMIVGGEMLTLACASQFYNDYTLMLQQQQQQLFSPPHSHLHSSLSSECRLINLFSTTETGDCSYFHVSPPVIQELLETDKYIHCPIGSSIDGVELSIDIVGDKGLIVGGVDSNHYLSAPLTTAQYFDSRGWLSYDQATFINVCGEQIIMLTGRSDDCVKIRGFKVDLNAVEEAIALSGTVLSVSAQHLPASDSLIAFIVLKAELCSSTAMTAADPTDHPSLKLIDRLPKSHRPQVIEVLQTMPIGRTGKVDRRTVLENYLQKQKQKQNDLANSLRSHSEQEDEEEEEEVTANPIVSAVCAAWRQVLHLSEASGGQGQGQGLDLHKSFWDCGGHSLLAMQLCAKLHLPSALLFGGDLSTAQDMIDHLESKSKRRSRSMSSGNNGDSSYSSSTSRNHPAVPFQSDFPTLPAAMEEPVAIIGMSGRWPGIGQTSCDDLFKAFTNDMEFEPLSASPSQSGSGNIHRGFYLDETLLKGFDNSFWNMTKDDALMCDPQLRSFLEMSYEAFCDAGVIVEPKASTPLNCGVFASSGSLPHYLELLLDGQSLSEVRTSDPAKYFNLELGNDKDYLATRLAYLLNLVGPVECVQTACSSGLVAVSHAVEAIRSGHCEVAIAGAVSIFSPQQEHGYMPDLIWSQDGRCRPFDAQASGTANCNGGQVFLLKSLFSAVRDGDAIYGCVKGSAIRNDGRLGKRNFNAPSSLGYTRTVEAALKNAQLKDGSGIRMLEAHATGTIVGDPIEMAGIAQGYGAPSAQPLSVGSVKGNIGHANTAAGPMAMAKSLMCIHRNQLVKSGNFTSCSDSMTHEMSKSERLIEIQTSNATFGMEPRMAGVSAMGIGGTCVHLILEQAPSSSSSSSSSVEDKEEEEEKEETVSDEGTGCWYYLPVSAASPASLTRYLQKLAGYVEQNKDVSVSALCATLGNRRPQLKYRKCLAIAPDSVHRISAALSSAAHATNTPFASPTASNQLPTISSRKKHQKTVALILSGQGTRLPRREAGCIPVPIPAAITKTLGFDPLERYWETGGTDPVLYQVAMFAVQMGIGAALVASLGADVQVVGLGHSLGEWAVAALAGLITMEEATLCVQARAEILVRYSGGGGMICVCSTLEETLSALEKFEDIDLEVACINSDDRIVLSGSLEGCEFFTTHSKLICKKVETQCAFHSKLVDKGMFELEQVFKKILTRSSCLLPNWRVVSSHDTAILHTGNCTPSYWAKQTRGCVNFANGVSSVGDLAGKEAVWLLSFGMSKTLCSKPLKAGIISVQNDQRGIDVKAAIMQGWEMGLPVKMETIVGTSRHHVLSLPAYEWDRAPCWPQSSGGGASRQPKKREEESKHHPAGDIHQTLFSESWLPVYSSYRHVPSKDTSPLAVQFNVGGTAGTGSEESSPRTQRSSLDASFRQAVEECCDSIKSHGRLVISTQTAETPRHKPPRTVSEGVDSAPTTQCFLLSRFLFLIQAILESPECLQALHSARPHASLSSVRGGVVLLLEEGEGEGQSLVEAGAVLGAARCVANEHPELHLHILRAEKTHVHKENSSVLSDDSCSDFFQKQLFVMFFDLDVPTGEYRCDSEGHMTVRTMLPLVKASAGSELQPVQVSDGGVYVISGGLGSLGKLVAEWLCTARAAKKVFLLTRRSGAVLSDEKLLIFGDRIQVMQADVCDLTSLSNCLDINWKEEVTGVVHCAGDVFDSLVSSAPTDQGVLEDQLFVKTRGFSNLLSLVQTSTEFIVFSSASGCLGSLGQVTYCAANSALDVMVDMERKQSGRRVASIQWGGWSKDIAGSMSDKYNVDPSGPFETFYSAESGISAMSHVIQSLTSKSETAACLAIDINCWDSYVASTGVSRSLLSSLLMKRFPCDVFGEGKLLSLPCLEQLLWQPQWHWLGDHRADGQIIFPATASLEILLLKNQMRNTCLHDVKFEKTIVAGDLLTIDSLKIETDKGVCVRAASSSPVNAKAGGGHGNNLPPRSAVCLTLASLSLTKARETLNVILSDRDLNIAIGHVKGRVETQKGQINEHFFPLAPELDACAHVCTALDEVAAASYPVGVDCFTIQKVTDFDSLDSFLGLESFYTEHSVTDDDWLVICRKHCPKIDLEFDIVCLRKRDWCIVSFERLCLKAMPQMAHLGGNPLSACVCVKMTDHAASLEVVSLLTETETEAETEKEDITTTSTSTIVSTKPEYLDANEDFEVVIDADYFPSFLPLPSIQTVPDDHIVVRVTTYALNFLDVLSAAGMMPKEYFGGECVGVVEEVGAQVTRLRAGDRVAVLLLGEGMKTRLSVPVHRASPPLPPSISDEEAATIPVAYATAWLALEWMGRIQEGETAFVHSAAGGVGLACVSILKSQAHRCRVFATCSPGKEAALQALGVAPGDIFHSRLPGSWMAGCLKAQGGKPEVSLCLGAFVGDSLSLSLHLMAPLGRVLDFGKRSQLEQSSMNMAPFLKGLTYSAAHLDELMTTYPEATEKLLNELWTSLNDKVIPLPYELFSVKDTQAGMKRLASGHLVGKVVLQFPTCSEPAWELVHSPHSLRRWTVGVDVGVGEDFSSEALEMLDLYLHKMGGGLQLKGEGESEGEGESSHGTPTVYLTQSRNDQNPFPEADSYTSHQRRKTVLISSEMGADLAFYAEYCATVCRHAALDTDSDTAGTGTGVVFMCMEKHVLQTAGCVPTAWRHIAREVKAAARCNGAQVDALQWLLGVVAQSTGMGHTDILAHTLEEVGFDSLSCLQLSHKLQQAFPHRTSFHIPSNVVIEDIFESTVPGPGSVSAGNVNKQSPHVETTSVPLTAAARTIASESQTKPKKWLALHGFRMNNQIFRHQLENIINEVDSIQQQQGQGQGSAGQDFFSMPYIDFPDAPLTALGPGEEGLEDLYVSIITSSLPHDGGSAGGGCGAGATCGEPMPLYEWWRSGVREEGYDTAWIGEDGLDQSCEWLRARVLQQQQEQEKLGQQQGQHQQQEKQGEQQQQDEEGYHGNAGGYAGVLGMSQGAGMAYLLLLAGVVPRALLFSPVGPVHCETHIQTMLRHHPPLPSASSSSSPLMVVWDPSDTPSEDFIRDTIRPGPLGARMQGVTHTGGHVVPQDVSAGKYARRRYIVEAIAKWLFE